MKKKRFSSEEIAALDAVISAFTETEILFKSAKWEISLGNFRASVNKIAFPNKQSEVTWTPKPYF